MSDTDRGQTTLILFALVITASVSVVVVAVALLFTMDLAGAFFDAVDVTGIGGATKTDISDGVGNAYVLYALALLAPPSAVVLYLLGGRRLGLLGSSSDARPPRSGGPF